MASNPTNDFWRSDERLRSRQRRPHPYNTRRNQNIPTQRFPVITIPDDALDYPDTDVWANPELQSTSLEAENLQRAIDESLASEQPIERFTTMDLKKEMENVQNDT